MRKKRPNRSRLTAREMEQDWELEDLLREPARRFTDPAEIRALADAWKNHPCPHDRIVTDEKDEMLRFKPSSGKRQKSRPAVCTDCGSFRVLYRAHKGKRAAYHGQKESGVTIKR